MAGSPFDHSPNGAVAGSTIYSPEREKNEAMRMSFLRCCLTAWLVCISLLMWGLSAHAATPLSALRYAPDVTVTLGSGNVTVGPNAIAADDLGGNVSAANVGAIPVGAAIAAYHRKNNGDQLFVFDTTVVLSGITFTPQQVVRYDGTAYSLYWDGAANSIPAGVRIDGLALQADVDLLLSLDVSATLGGVAVSPTDIVRFNGTYSMFFNGVTAGVPAGLNLQDFHFFDSDQHLLMNFDSAGAIGGTSFNRQDVLEYTAGSPGTWELIYNGVAQSAGWASGDLTALWAAAVLPTTTTTLVSSLNPSTFGQSVTLTATVSGGTAPTGSVTFLDGAIVLATVAVNGTGQASYTSAALTVGAHPINAQYGGDGTHAASNAVPLQQQVNAIVTTTALVSSVNPSASGQSVSFTATVSGGTTPAGSVGFYDGAVLLNTVALDGAGQATLSTAALGVGGHNITALYLPADTTHAGSVSPALNQIVIGTGVTNVTLGSSANPSVFGTSVTFTATVAGPTTPTGTVTFFDGVNSLGTVSLVGGVATLSTSALGVASHGMTVHYNGDATFGPNTSAVLIQVVTAVVGVNGGEVQAIPTLGEWGVFILCALMSLFGVAALRRMPGK